MGMNDIYFANCAGSVIDFNSCKNSRRYPGATTTNIPCAELEELIADIREFMQHAQNSGDAFEYYRLGEELRLAEAARQEADFISFI